MQEHGSRDIVLGVNNIRFLVILVTKTARVSTPSFSFLGSRAAGSKGTIKNRKIIFLHLFDPINRIDARNCPKKIDIQQKTPWDSGSNDSYAKFSHYLLHLKSNKVKNFFLEILDFSLQVNILKFCLPLHPSIFTQFWKN